MTRRLLLSLSLAMLLIMIVSIMLTVSATSKILTGRQEALLREVVDIVTNGYQVGGEEFVNRINTSSYRITVISPTGKILSDDLEDLWYLITDQKTLDRFLHDIIELDTIISVHTQFIFGELILAGRSLPDDTIIVASTTMKTFGDTIVEMKMQIMLILLLSLILSAILARALTSFIVKPLNKVDLEDPDITNEYKEIQPLLRKIQDQKRDIAEQEEELRQGQREFNTVSESLKEGLFLVGQDDSIMFINKAAKKILSLKGDISGKSYKEVLPESISRTIEETANNSRSKCIYQRSNMTYNAEATSIKEDGVRVGTSVLIYDITSVLNAEAQRREFTANVSHELKTPLHIIAGSAELLRSGIVKEEDKLKFIDQIYNESQRMKSLVEDIMKISKLEEGKQEIKKSAVNAYELALSVKENLMHLADEGSIELDITGDRNIDIFVNASMIYGAIYNLVDNAIKYSNKGGKVLIRVSSDEAKCYIDVEDEGVGIPEECHERIFERFYRVDKSRSKEVGGTGLGLAIVKHSCIANGGEVTLTSRENKGSKFTMTFPKHKEE